jgi:predicted  nucleic acid-binding Zn-ribbon protein
MAQNRLEVAIRENVNSRMEAVMIEMEKLDTNLKHIPAEVEQMNKNFETTKEELKDALLNELHTGLLELK